MNEDCDEGLDCERGTCVNENQKSTDLASFEDSDIIYTNTNGTKFYLHVNSRGSNWSLTPQVNSFSYSSSTNRLFITGNSGNIIIRNDGTLATSSGDGTFIRFFRQGQVESFADDVNNQISSASMTIMNANIFIDNNDDDLALFVDHRKYPRQSVMIVSHQVFVQVVPR